VILVRVRGIETNELVRLGWVVAGQVIEVDGRDVDACGIGEFVSMCKQRRKSYVTGMMVEHKQHHGFKANYLLRGKVM